MRIAILIGISKYINCDSLPNCDNDIKAVSDVIKASQEFDDIKIFKNDVKSDELKSQLSDLFIGWKRESIDEIFFYFTGHGSFYKDEFYYILTDFDENKRRQTSLQNKEIDNMIKSICPKMVTKVIDACQSGISYIKGNSDVVKKYYSETKGNFNKCYFLHSSMANQYSYVNNELSDFTKSFLASIKANSSKQKIRYKDIIDYISDEFESSTEQTPFFITQADHTETFLPYSDNLNKVLKSLFSKDDKYENSENPEKEEIKYNSYIDKIKKDAEIYSSKEEVDDLFVKIKELIESTNLETDLKDLYSIQSIFKQYLNDLPKRIAIGRWLENNNNDFFAETEYEKIAYKEEEQQNLFWGISQILQPNKIITKYKYSIVGFNHTVDLLYKSVLIDYVPKYPNLVQYAFLITFLISKKDINLFYAFTNYKEQDWNKKIISDNFKWQSIDFLLKDQKDIIEFIKKQLEKNEMNISNILKKKFEIE